MGPDRAHVTCKMNRRLLRIEGHWTGRKVEEKNGGEINNIKLCLKDHNETQCSIYSFLSQTIKEGDMKKTQVEI